MRKINEGYPPPDEVVERFIVRARRVECHSLVVSGATRKYAKPTMHLHVSTSSGEITVDDSVITDEEALESLASRLRPFLVRSEPIFLPRVLEAIRVLVGPEALARNTSYAKVLDSTETWFHHRFVERDSSTYTVQLLDAAGNPLSRDLSDVLLGEAWLYTDTVHADPHGAKAEGKKLGFEDRYKAASSLFSEVSIAVLEVLRVVRNLSGAKLLGISGSAWAEPVSYAEVSASTEPTRVEDLYVFKQGTMISPDMRPQDIPGAVKVTPMVLGLMTSPESLTAVNLYDVNGDPIASYVACWRLTDDILEILVDDILLLKVSRDVLSGESCSRYCFEPVSGREAEARLFLNQFSSPGHIEIEFEYDSRHLKLVIPAGTPSDGKENERE